MNKKNVIIYRTSTILITLFMLFGASMYFFNHAMVVDMFNTLGFPSYLVYPLAVLKLLGLIAIWTNKSKTLKYLAYAGFMFTFILASSAHWNVGDGEFFVPFVALILISVSFVYDRKRAVQTVQTKLV